METLSVQSQTRRTIRDLAALSALPAVWANYNPLQVAEGLAEALLGTLPLDFVYLKLSRRVCGQETEVSRTSLQANSEDRTREIGHALAPLLAGSDIHSVQSIPNPIGSGPLRIVAAPVGFPEPDGLVVAGSKRTDFPSEDERLLLDVGVKHAAMVLEHIMAEETRRTSEQRLAADLADMSRLQEVSTQLVQAGYSRSLLLEIVDTAIAVTSAEMGTIQLLDRGSATLKIVASRGFESAFLEFFNAVSGGHCTCGTAMHHGERVVIEDVGKSPLFVGTPSREVMLAANAQAVQATPLVARSGRLVGMLSTYYRVPRSPADRDLHFIDLLARQAANWIERTEAEDALRLSEGRIRQLFSMIPAAVYTCDAEGRIDFYNQRAAELWGREPPADERFCGSWRLYRLDGSSLPHDQTPMAACVREGRSARNIAVAIEHPSGICPVVSVNVEPLRDSQGHRVGAISFFEDITERMRADRATRESADRLQTLSRRLLEVQEAERRHLARELHDEIGQMLTSLRLHLNWSGDVAPDAVQRGFESARSMIEELLEKVRRLSFDLRPAELDQLGLLPALIALFERFTDQMAVRINFKHQSIERRFASEVETTAYRIIQESLTNVARHAGVDQAMVRVWTTSDTLGLQIEDHGRGFDPKVILGAPLSIGLAGMRERVELLSGRLTIETRPGDGTLITAELPAKEQTPWQSNSRE